VAGLLAFTLVASIASWQRADTADATIPVKFTTGTVAGAGFSVTHPTTIAIHPVDGRLFVGDDSGRVVALTLDPNTKQVTASETIATAAQLQEVFGITFDPADPAAVYVTNTISGFGAGFTQAPPSGSPGSYAGKITKIKVGVFTDVITNLPVSNSGHESNGLEFGPDGNLYIAQGGQTNAGVIDAGGTLFQRIDVALGGAMLQADVTDPGFDGNVTYSEGDVYSTTTDVTNGDVNVYASGLRNPYDLVFHSNGRLYVTDNGPNDTYGPGSTGCSPATDTGVDAAQTDELNIVTAGSYYGHPNRNRGRTDVRQCVYHENGTPSSGGYTGAIALLPVSSNGITEYKSNKFAGQMQGDLLIAAWVNSELRRIKLSPDGLSVVEHTTLATNLANALDVTTSTDGTIFVAEYGGNKITFLKPDETGGAPTVTGVVPGAGSIAGGQSVTISGTNFTTTTETTVTIGGQPLANKVVQNSTTITGTTPPNTAGAKNVIVTNSNGSATLTNGYTYSAGGGAVPPVANAGEDWSGPLAHGPHSHVTLDGRGSLDPDGFIVSYRWNEGSPTGTLLSENPIDSVQFLLGTHTVWLTVTDDTGLTHSDDVRVTVTSTAENPELYWCNDPTGDGINNSGDLGLVAAAFGKKFLVTGYQRGVAGPADDYSRLKDFNGDRIINSGDLGGTASYFGACSETDQMIRDATNAMETVPVTSGSGIRDIGFQDVRNARALGYIQVVPFIPGQGAHYMRNPGIANQDPVMDLLYPESLLYEPSSSTPGGWKLGAPMYVVPYESTIPPGGTGGIPPEGFPGSEDAWHYHKDLCVWGWNGTSYTAVAENMPETTCMNQSGSPVWTPYAGWLLHVWNFEANPAGRMVEVSNSFNGQ
jgi:glucose/arabinose dehydrogenase